MKLKVKPTGNNGQHVYIPKSLGYKVGDFVEINNKCFREKVEEIVEDKIAALRNY